MAEADSKDELTPAAGPDAQGEDFAQMLDAEGVHQQPRPTNEVAVGDEVSGVIVKVEDENSFVEYGSRDEAIIRTSELKGPDGEMRYKVGDPIAAFVVTVGDEGPTQPWIESPRRPGRFALPSVQGRAAR